MTIRRTPAGKFTIRGPDGAIVQQGVEYFTVAKAIEERVYREADVTPPRYKGVYCNAAKQYPGAHISSRDIGAMARGEEDHAGTPVMRMRHIGNFKTLDQARMAADVARLLSFSRRRLNFPLVRVIRELTKLEQHVPGKRNAELREFLLENSGLENVRAIWVLGSRRKAVPSVQARMLEIHRKAREHESNADSTAGTEEPEA